MPMLSETLELAIKIFPGPLFYFFLLNEWEKETIATGL
jgi:hypothetical protein